jgi:hypothetical protein
LCPAGEFVVSSLRVDVLALADAEKVVAPRIAATASLVSDFATADDFSLRIRRSLGSSSFSPRVVSDLAISLRI